MKKVTSLKVILILVVGLMLLVTPINIFAATEGPADLDSLWTDLEDQGDKGDLKPEETTPPPETTPPTPSTETEKPNNKLPDAGLAEDTMMVISIIVLGATAIYTFKKVNDYKNI